MRETLGDHIDQKGSLVAPEKLRFDFSHKAQISVTELSAIENMSLGWIKRNVPVFSKELDLQQAYKIPGVRAVFGEAYPSPVRVVSLEYDVDEIAKDIEQSKWRKTSIEFCGGTLVMLYMVSRPANHENRHVAKTGDIQDFVITEESGIAKGIRRIVAATGHEAHEITRLAQLFKEKLDRAELIIGKEKELALKSLTVVRSTCNVLWICYEHPQKELGQANISVIKKAELKDRLATIRKSFEKQLKEIENAANKKVRQRVHVLWHFDSVYRLLKISGTISRRMRNQIITSRYLM